MGALRDFVADLLEGEGAVIEPVEPDGLDVLAPEQVRNTMGWPELARLGFGAQLPPGAMPIGLEGDWLDRFGALLGDRGRFAERQLVLPVPVAPPTDPERRLNGVLDLRNAIWRLRDARAVMTRCLLLAFRYTATSDERREGLIWLGFNAGTGTVLEDDMVDRLRHLLANDMEWRAPDPDALPQAGPASDAAILAERTRARLDHLVRRDLEPFLRAMRRRLDRDCGRVHEYHADLRRSALTARTSHRSATSEKAEADRKRESMRVAAIEREYAAKLDDLRHNYALRVKVDWVQGLVLFAPVHRYEVLIRRRKGERIVAIDWHPAVRMMEPPVCDWGLGLERARLVCDDHLHLTDLAGQAACPSCGKAWCRACQGPACPRCKRSSSSAKVQ
jgi:hypothetical protein